MQDVRDAITNKSCDYRENCEKPNRNEKDRRQPKDDDDDDGDGNEEEEELRDSHHRRRLEEERRRIEDEEKRPKRSKGDDKQQHQKEKMIQCTGIRIEDPATEYKTNLRNLFNMYCRQIFW